MKLGSCFFMGVSAVARRSVFGGSGDGSDSGQFTEDGKVVIQQRNMFGDALSDFFGDSSFPVISPNDLQVFTALETSTPEPEEIQLTDKRNKTKPPVKQDNEDDEDFDGVLEGFDKSLYEDSDAYKKIQQAIILSNGFQRGNNGFGNINGGPDSPGVIKSTAKRVSTVMKMIMYLQVDPNFDKFFQYGCFCFPDGEKSVLGGYGEARDGADLICKKYHNCQRCLDNDYVDCPEWTPYKYRGIKDKETGTKKLICLNKEGSCRRNHCECDKRLAEQLVEYEMAWDPSYSLAFGGFNRSRDCPAVEKRTNSNHDNQHECCGEYPERYPYVSESETGQLRKCCVNKTYDPRVLACCQDGILKQHGTCGV